MKEVFINYRTGDGDEAAVLVGTALSHRFGAERIFLASSSIAPGEAYPEKLLEAVRRSEILLAIVGPGWPQDSRLHDEDDWVRREILEAHACGIRVIPLLKGRKTDRLSAEHLPQELSWLADVQSLRLETRNSNADLRHIGDFLADVVPALMEADREVHQPPNDDRQENAMNNITGTVVQVHEVTGDIGRTIIKNTQGQVHAGKGDINQSTQHFSGDGGTYIQGNNTGGVNHRFGRPDPDGDER